MSLLFVFLNRPPAFLPPVTENNSFHHQAVCVLCRGAGEEEQGSRFTGYKRLRNTGLNNASGVQLSLGKWRQRWEKERDCVDQTSVPGDGKVERKADTSRVMRIPLV